MYVGGLYAFSAEESIGGSSFSQVVNGDTTGAGLTHRETGDTLTYGVR